MNLVKKMQQQQLESKALPTALESEMYVIGAAMRIDGAVQTTFEILRHWHFYFEANKVIWKAVHRVIKSGKPITHDFLYMELCKKAYFEGEIDAGYLMQCLEAVNKGGANITKNNLICHRELVFETWSRRQLIDLGATMQFWGMLPGGHTSKMLEVFDKRKKRIESAYNQATTLEDLDSCRFDPKAIIPQDNFVLSLGIDAKNFGIAEPGCLVSISGGSGSRKTTLLTAIVASAFKETSIIGFKFERQGKILFFDTEQPKKRFQRTQRRIMFQCSNRNVAPYYEAYNLREKEVKERIQFIDKVIRANQKQGISAIIIDGILDLVENMNDLTECTNIIQRLMTWTTETNAVMFNVLHDMRSTGKMGGHLGSFLERKQDAEINVSLSENPDWSTVQFRKTRDSQRPRSFEFTQDERGNPTFATPINNEAIPF